MIIIKDLTKHYGSVIALDKVSFLIKKNDSLAVIGENGAGKSTLINILSGFVRKTKGSVKLGSSKIGVMSQDSIMDEKMTVFSFLKLMSRLEGVKGDIKKYSLRLLEQVELLDKAKNKIGKLSHGMRKRLQIAQALIGSPSILIFDEPVSGLDPRIARKIKDLIMKVSSNKTLIYCTHNLQEVEEVCKTVLMLHKGRIMKKMSLTDLTNHNKIIAKYSRKPKFLASLNKQKYIKSVIYENKRVEVVLDNNKYEEKVINKLLTADLISLKRGVSLESEFLKNTQ